MNAANHIAQILEIIAYKVFPFINFYSTAIDKL